MLPLPLPLPLPIKELSPEPFDSINSTSFAFASSISAPRDMSSDAKPSGQNVFAELVGKEAPSTLLRSKSTELLPSAMAKVGGANLSFRSDTSESWA
ncbi:hypothetical protein PISMIDRAFT_680738, partial [Pisolithus microcarpus 441]